MPHFYRYSSPLGDILLTADDIGLTGLCFDEPDRFHPLEPPKPPAAPSPAIDAAVRWLDIYFSGREPDLSVPLHPIGTDFQTEVWEMLRTVPCGRTTTYGEIADRIAHRRGIARMSAQAVGGAVGHNKIALLIPCHRVIGADGSLTGYAGGLDRKRKLLNLERSIAGYTPEPIAAAVRTDNH